MCFKNLPIEFDAHGKPHLRSGETDPFGTSGEVQASTARPPSGEKIEELLARNGHIRSVDFDPVTRVAGALAFHAVADLEGGKIVEARSMATLFRGYEVIMLGRDPRDAIFITSRACGVCGGVHSVTSAMAIEMAFGVTPPPLGVVVRNLALAAEFLYDHPLHLFLLAGPDYSEAIVRQTNPELWERAARTAAPHAERHGYRTIGDIMVDMNPLTGKLYVEALHMTRVIREAYVLLCGKYPHPQTIVPGGMSTTLSTSTFNEFYVRLAQFFEYSKKVVPLWDDLCDFFFDANPNYRRVGARPKNLIDSGIWDHHEAYDGVEEFVEHSYYEEWDGGRFTTDPVANPLSPYHPWNKQTRPKPSGQNWREKYTWDTAPRWDRLAMEAGAYARMWNTAVARKIAPNPFIEATGTSLKLRLPQGALPETELEWKVPEAWNALERNRARAYCIPYTALVAMVNWLAALELVKKAQTRVSAPFEVPMRGQQIGVGFWGAGRGWLTHHLVLQDGVVANYQILTPSTWNASPLDPWKRPGPYEEAVLNTPILESFSRPEDYKGIDILRTIRSFDPCMPCTTHIHTDERVISREVTTCACGFDD